MKIKTLIPSLFIIGLLLTNLSSCKKEEITLTTQKPNKMIQLPDTIVDPPVEPPINPPVVPSVYTPLVSNSKISIAVDDKLAKVNSIVAGRTYYNIDYIFANLNIPIKSTYSSITQDDTKLLLSMFKLDNEQADARRPQGVANYGKYVINSWQFQEESTWYKNCKLTILDPTIGKYINVVPVTFHDTQINRFKHIDSHAGGLTVVDHYLYLADGTSILIFDLDKIYPIINKSTKSDPLVATDQNFIYEYTVMIPQIGSMSFIPEMGTAAYISQTNINSQNYFVVGNFFYSSSKNPGVNKSMIWLLPFQTNAYAYPTIKINTTNNEYITLNPVFPNGSAMNKTITCIQGAIVKDNILVLNRSWSGETYQLIVMKYSNILMSNTILTDFFCGNDTNWNGYDSKNWLDGCEDLEFYDNRIWTITEFGTRAVYSTSWTNITNLIAGVN